MKNYCLEAALQELGRHGIRDVTKSFGSKHLQIRWSVNGHPERMYSMAVSPSDTNAIHAVRAAIRRMLREDGIMADQPKSPVSVPKPSHRIASLESRVATLEKKIETLFAKPLGA
jgi:hypothetical protein